MALKGLASELFIYIFYTTCVGEQHMDFWITHGFLDTFLDFYNFIRWYL